VSQWPTSIRHSIVASVRAFCSAAQAGARSRGASGALAAAGGAGCHKSGQSDLEAPGFIACPGIGAQLGCSTVGMGRGQNLGVAGSQSTLSPFASPRSLQMIYLGVWLLRFMGLPLAKPGR